MSSSIAYPASAIVRVKDEATTIGATLESLRAQTVPVEIVVVDSGSTDGTLDVARSLCDRLIEIPASDFTYGHSLNVGAEAASAPIHFALSAHCVARTSDWVERTLALYDRPDVAGVNGIQTFADRTPVTETFFQTAEHARRNPFWGFSNHASSWRATAWHEYRFDETLDYAEDREWSWRVMDAGWVIAFDPYLWVDLDHSWHLGTRGFFERQRRGARGVGAFADLPPYGVLDLATDWWHVPDERHSALFHRANPKRLAGLLGAWLGRREARAGGGRVPAPQRTKTR